MSLIVRKQPPLYDVRDDVFFHGPAWVIKPRLFVPRETFDQKKPGVGSYHIPDRSIYARPGKTIGSRFETVLPDSSHLLAHYTPNDQGTSKFHMPSISITPRRSERLHLRDHSGRFYLPLEISDRAPRFRLPCGPSISRKDHSLCISPGSAAYPMYEFDEDILPRPQAGFTQKHRLPLTEKPVLLPFYYPVKGDRHRLPSFSIGKLLPTSKKLTQYTTPSYEPVDHRALCTSVTKPGVTLKGRWSSAVYMGV